MRPFALKTVSPHPAPFPSMDVVAALLAVSELTLPVDDLLDARPLTPLSPEMVDTEHHALRLESPVSPTEAIRNEPQFEWAPVAADGPYHLIAVSDSTHPHQEFFEITATPPGYPPPHALGYRPEPLSTQRDVSLGDHPGARPSIVLADLPPPAVAAIHGVLRHLPSPHVRATTPPHRRRFRPRRAPPRHRQAPPQNGPAVLRAPRPRGPDHDPERDLARAAVARAPAPVGGLPRRGPLRRPRPRRRDHRLQDRRGRPPPRVPRHPP